LNQYLPHHQAVASLAILNLEFQNVVDCIERFFVVASNIDPCAAWSRWEIPCSCDLSPAVVAVPGAFLP